MSVAQRLGLPDPFQAALLLFTFVLALTPYLAGTSLGFVQIPSLPPRQRRLMKIVGPLVLCTAILLVLPSASRSDLRLLAVDFTDAGQIDVAIANGGTRSALLTKIELELLRDHRVRVRPALAATATYRLPIDSLSEGERRAIMVRHLIPASATERILIAPETGRASDVRLRIYAEGVVLTRDVRLWPQR